MVQTDFWVQTCKRNEETITAANKCTTLLLFSAVSPRHYLILTLIYKKLYKKKYIYELKKRKCLFKPCLKSRCYHSPQFPHLPSPPLTFPHFLSPSLTIPHPPSPLLPSLTSPHLISPFFPSPHTPPTFLHLPSSSLTLPHPHPHSPSTRLPSTPLRPTLHGLCVRRVILHVNLLVYFLFICCYFSVYRN